MDDGPDVGSIVNDVGLEASTSPVIAVTLPASGSNVGPIVLSDVGLGASTAPVISVTPPPGEVSAVGTVAMDGTAMNVD